MTSNFKEINAKTTPEGWNYIEFGKVIDINPKRELKKGTTGKYLEMAQVDEFVRYNSNFVLKEFKGGSKFANGDTLMARITPCLENGKTTYVDFLVNNEIGFGSTEFIVLSSKDNITDKNFVYYLAISPEIRQIAIQSMAGSSGRQRVQNDVLSNTKIAIPNFNEQKIIGRILSNYDDKIKLLKEKNEKLEEIAKLQFKQWLVNPKDIPSDWETKPLDEIADYLNGLAMQKFPMTDENNFLQVIKIRELNGGINEGTDKASADIDEKYIIKDGDILFSWSGTLKVIIWCGGKGALNQHLFKVTSEEYPKWFYYLWTKHHLEEFIQIAKSKATTMGHIQRKHLKNAMVLIPTKDELEKMDKVLNPIIEQIINQSIEIRTLTKIRDTLLPKLMSGQIRLYGDENLTNNGGL